MAYFLGVVTGEGAKAVNRSHFHPSTEMTVMLDDDDDGIDVPLDNTMMMKLKNILDFTASLSLSLGRTTVQFLMYNAYIYWYQCLTL